jgi:hypothetical protein
MKQTKLVLKKEVKYFLLSFIFAAVISLFGIIIAKSIYNINDSAKRCDDLKGYTCTYYDIQNFMRGGK